MVTIPKPSSIQSSKLAVTSAPIIQGRDDGAGLVAKSISELAGTTHEVFKDAVEKLNLAKDNAWIAEKKAEVDKFAIEFSEQSKVNYSEGLDGYAEGVKSQIIAKQEKLLAEAPNEIIRNKLKTYFPGQSTYWFNKAYQNEVSASSSYLTVQLDNTLKQEKEQVYNHFLDDGDIQGSHSIKMRGVDAIKDTANVFLNDEEIEKKLKTWNKDFVEAMFLGMAKNTKNQTSFEITQILTAHLDNNKEEFIELLDGEENFENLRADVLKAFPESIGKEFARNEKALEVGYDGSVYRTVEQGKDDLYKKTDDGSFEIDVYDGSKVIDELAKNKIQPSIDVLPDYQREATEKYILENTNVEKYKIEDNPQAVEQIDILIADDQDPRQELDYSYSQGLINVQTYRKKMNEYNKITGSDLKDRALQNKIKLNEATLKDLKVTDAMSNYEITQITNGWSDILSIKGKEDFYKNNSGQHDKDFVEFLKTSGRHVASIYKTTGSPMPLQSNVSKSALVDGDETALNEVLVDTLVYAQNTWPDDMDKQKEYLQQQAGLINEVKNVWEVNHIDSKTMKPTPFIWRDINKGVLEKIKQGLEIEKVDPYKRGLSSTERRKQFNNFSFDRIYEKIEEITTAINETPSYITAKDRNVKIYIEEHAQSLYDLIAEKAKTKETDVFNFLSKEDIKNILNQSVFLEFQDRGIGDFYPTKVVKTFDPEFKHVKQYEVWKKKLKQAGERATGIIESSPGSILLKIEDIPVKE